jgi:acetyltransferase
MSIRNLDKLFRPDAVALIGASSRANTVGAVALRNLVRAGFRGPLFPVNPKHQTLEGLKVYPDVKSLPRPPDLAIVATPPIAIPKLIGDLGAIGTKAAVVISAGFGGPGADACALQQAALNAAKPHLLRLVGPNCVGLMVPAIGLNASFAHVAPTTGDLAFVSQSGAIITAVLDWAAPRRIGFSHVVSLGDMADVDFGDMLDYLAADRSTRGVLLYIEGITHARKFMSAARAAARIKPVVAIKAGRFHESALAARSHTGALAGSDAVYDAAFRRAGMLRVNCIAELFAAIETLALTTAQHGDRLAIVTNGGGPGVLATDALITMGGHLAALSPDTMRKLNDTLPSTWSHGNPVDILGDAPAQRYVDTLALLLTAPEVDAVLALNCPTAVSDTTEAARAIIRAIAGATVTATQRRNVYTSWLGDQSATAARDLFAKAHIATYDTPDAAVQGFMHRVQYHRNQELLTQTPETLPATFEPDRDAAGAAIGRTLAAGRYWLDAQEVDEVLRAYAIPRVAGRVVADPAAAAAAAAEIGHPVALKIRSPDLIHKSEVGGVVLNIANPDDARAAAFVMAKRLKAACPHARLDGFLVQEMVNRTGTLELFVGLGQDQTFGPVVMFGHGGVAVELLNDTSIGLPPLNMALARAQMARTRVWRLLGAHRGRPPADVDSIAKVLISIGHLAIAHPEIQELDINPLLADARGVVALDARIGVCKERTSLRPSIAPYPKELESKGILNDGTRIQLRPVRPEDEPLLQDIVKHMTATDLLLRFFYPMKQLPHALGARLSQIDYDREMALLAQPEDADTALGVVRYSADPDGLEAEFAVSVRSDWKGRGLGHLLMTRLLEVAKQRRIGALVGDVHCENQPMLTLCRSLNFEITANSNDRSLRRVCKKLDPELPSTAR